MSEAHLRFSTNILRRLGEELNPNPDQGLLELIKNAYDADARHCTIELLNTHQAGGTVTVMDDGHGMDREGIEEGWLVLGRSSKNINMPTTRLGRLPAGNKGLGRLAALRMGSVASLISRPVHDPQNEYQLDINWSTFDQFDVVEDVVLEIQKRKRSPDSKNGTSITISGLGSQINRMEVKRLARGILLLADPFEDNPTGFHPVLKAPEFKDLEKLVKRRYFDDAEFHLIAKVDEFGQAKASVMDWKDNILFTAEHSDLWTRSLGQLYACPPATFDLWVFILDRQTFSQRPTTTVGEVKEWLAEFGGVHLYIRGLRVSPYGNPGNDWLDLNLSRVRSPELRPSTNTSIGRIAITDPTEELVQKTDRSGLVEGEAFQELRRFAIDALDWMARKRKDERDRRRSENRTGASKKVEKAKETVEEAIKDLPSLSKRKIKDTFDKYDRERDREAHALRKEVQLYRTMSTAGITASVFAHESKHPLKLIIQNARQVDRRGREHFSSKYKELIEEPVSRILRQADTLQAFGNLTLSLIDHEKRRTSRVDVHMAINNVLKMFELFLKDRCVQVTLTFNDGSPYLRGSEAAIESIIANLLTNSLKALETGSVGERRIDIRTEITPGLLRLRMLDNGPGIHGLSTKDIWLPGETTYPNGTGLGLTIVRDTVNDLGGEVNASKNGELGGAEIIIELPILGV